MSWDKNPLDIPKTNIADKETGDNAVGQARIISYREAAKEALYQALKSDPRVFLFGEGIDDPTGVFGTTTNLHKEFGGTRVFDTPVAENALTGIAIGASLVGFRPVLIHMRTDFMLMSIDQLMNHAAKWKYMYGGKISVPIVVRAIIGGGWGSAAQHSQPFQAIFAHIPGLKVVMPSTAYDVKGLLLASIADNSPVIFIEHRWLYDNKEAVPEAPYLIPIGKALVRRPGKDVTIIATSFMVRMASEAIKVLEKEGIDIELIDLRTIKPLDTETILNSVKKTGRAMILDFGYGFCGISAEISAFLADNAFDYLKVPIKRIALPDIPTPASAALEKLFYPSVDKIISEIKKMKDRM